MTLDDIKQRIENGINGASVELSGDGCNCSAIIVAASFDGLSLLARQKMVLATVKDAIESGDLHALSIKTYTPSEQTKQN